MNLQEQEQFYQMMTRLRANSRPASTPKDDVLVTEMINGVIVTRPAKKFQEITANNEAKPTSEPQIIDL